MGGAETAVPRMFGRRDSRSAEQQAHQTCLVACNVFNQIFLSLTQMVSWCEYLRKDEDDGSRKQGREL